MIHGCWLRSSFQQLVKSNADANEDDDACIGTKTGHKSIFIGN